MCSEFAILWQENCEMKSHIAILCKSKVVITLININRYQ